MRYALVDCRMSDDVASALGAYADVIVRMPPFEVLSEPVSSHPDMLVWICGKYVVTYAEYKKRANAIFDDLCRAGYEVICSNEKVSAEYPRDIALNCALVGKWLLCNEKSVSVRITELSERLGVSVENTKQGYAKCATVVVSDNAIITADTSVSRSARRLGMDVLTIREGYVGLDGYDTGFIGGASGVLPDKVLFCGDVLSHPDGEAMIDFCAKYGKKAVSLSKNTLYDYGSIYFLDE